MPTPLQFRADGSFVVVQFTDLHWSDGREADGRTRVLMDRVLAAEKPNLVILTGDVIEGSVCEDPARAWIESVGPMEEHRVPWAAVFGNHDAEGSLDRSSLMATQRGSPMCLSDAGPGGLPGVGNYTLLIRSAAADSPAAAIYLLDSGSYAPSEIGGYATIDKRQIDWFMGVSRELGRARSASRGPSPQDLPLPALSFFHIPLPEYKRVWGRSSCRGSKHEEVCCPSINTGFFAALRAAGGVMGVFVGHDHANDYEGTLDGIRLCYGRATGYGGYGHDGFARGARVIRLREGERAFSSWIRLDGQP